MSLLDAIAEQISGCTRCPLAEGRTHAVPGVGPPDAQIMLVGEAPGAEEDAQGEPFVGKAGQALTILLRNAGLDRSDVYITNIVKCRPPENRDPHPDEVQACREYLDGQIACIRPMLVCTLGRWAGQTLLDDPGLSVMKANGTVIERHGLTFVPLIHPAAGLHNQNMQEPIKEGFRKLGELLRERG
ncbi:MAG: uracil-DNA glycosylase [Armatimonadota bacterium]|jgi:uracil-DNA glycosylase family 4